MTLLLAISFAYAGLTALALAMKRHHEALLNRKPTPGQRLACRLIGIALLALMLACCLHLWPIGLALALALGLITLAGLPLIFLLPYHPGLARRLALALPAAALAGTAITGA